MQRISGVVRSLPPTCRFPARFRQQRAARIQGQAEEQPALLSKASARPHHREVSAEQFLAMTGAGHLH